MRGRDVAVDVEQPGTDERRKPLTSSRLARMAAVLGVPRELALALLAIAIALTVTVIPAPFTIDDVNYLATVTALREGRLTMPGTDGLTPSSELVFFDPGPEDKVVRSTPVASTAPPLYAPIALPFSFLGWRGLVAINTCGYLLTIALVFQYTRRCSVEAATPWIAAAAIGGGGFVIEYAQGLWPHGLSLALCTAGILLVARTLNEGLLSHAAAAGFLLAVAAGIRYQNAVLIVVALGAIVTWSPRKWRTAGGYIGGAILPLSLSALMNHARLDSWNPISKGPGYLDVPVVGTDGTALDPLLLFLGRLVDGSVRPPLLGEKFSWVTYDPITGGHWIFGTTLQKAFLQSVPWAVLAFSLFVVAWLPQSSMSRERRNALRLFSLISFALPAAFALSGRGRNEGVSFNQRYLLELLPLAAISFAWAIDGLRFRASTMGAGGLWGVLLVLVTLALPIGAAKAFAVMKLPLLLASGLALVWFLSRRRERWQRYLAAVAGVCLGWALTLHLVDDVVASRLVRSNRLERTMILRRTLPDRSALVAYWGERDATGPLLLEKDIVVLDAHADEGRTAPALIRELLARGRRVFVLKHGMPQAVVARVIAGLTVTDDLSSGISEVRTP